jgi:hypothetical protein
MCAHIKISIEVLEAILAAAKETYARDPARVKKGRGLVATYMEGNLPIVLLVADEPLTAFRKTDTVYAYLQSAWGHQMTPFEYKKVEESV